jgi:hypothetical protein
MKWRKDLLLRKSTRRSQWKMRTDHSLPWKVTNPPHPTSMRLGMRTSQRRSPRHPSLRPQTTSLLLRLACSPWVLPPGLRRRRQCTIPMPQAPRRPQHMIVETTLTTRIHSLLTRKRARSVLTPPRPRLRRVINPRRTSRHSCRPQRPSLVSPLHRLTCTVESPRRHTQASTAHLLRLQTISSRCMLAGTTRMFHNKYWNNDPSKRTRSGGALLPRTISLSQSLVSAGR